MYNYEDIWNPVWSVVGETLNCKRKVKNPQDLYAISLRKYGTTVGCVLYVIPCICTLFFNKAKWYHQAHFVGPRQY